MAAGARPLLRFGGLEAAIAATTGTDVKSTGSLAGGASGGSGAGITIAVATGSQKEKEDEAKDVAMLDPAVRAGIAAGNINISGRGQSTPCPAPAAFGS